MGFLSTMRLTLIATVKIHDEILIIGPQNLIHATVSLDLKNELTFNSLSRLL